ncbi:MAG: histidinol dehydrogenase [Clostridia bacterium]|nr:histidinol dehydrogenase [Clostridia bacterium]
MIKIYKTEEIADSEVLTRHNAVRDVSAPVADIIKNVRERGDEALFEYSERFDGVKLASLEVGPDELDSALEKIGELADILIEARDNISHFHSRQVTEGFIVTDRPGIVLGQRVTPLERVGVYVPGGTAAYPSTVLMNIVPAKLAGVGEIIMVTPPGKNGGVAPAILAAAKLAGADRVFTVGGAQAVAALAYGTESIPAVNKIVGPGNAWVAEAKRQVFGKVGIDMVAGPSEVLVIADENSDPSWVAADMLSQAEHDKMAQAVLITDSEALASAVALELDSQLKKLPREEIARASIDDNGKIIVCRDLEEGLDIANRIAPEHLELCVDDPFGMLCKVRNAGSVFLGRFDPEPVGDYFAGPNHTLPTMGTAKFASPLGVEDFVKRSQFSYYTASALAADAPKIAAFARSEGLTAHAAAVEARRDCCGKSGETV